MSGRQLFWDEARGLRYYIDHDTHELVYEDGSRREWLPRTAVPGPSRLDSSGNQTVWSTSTRSQNYRHDVAGTTEEVAGTADVPGRTFKHQPREFWRQHRVFALQPGPSGLGSSGHTALLSNLRDEDITHSGVCRFVIIQEPTPQGDHVLALPILSYGGQGVAAEGVIKNDHGIVFTGKAAPKPSELELPGRGQEGMAPNHVRVSQQDPREKLHPRSRINYGQPTWIPITAQVHEIGMVSRDDRDLLVRQYQRVQRRKRQEEEEKRQEEERKQQEELLRRQQEEQRKKQEEMFKAEAKQYQTEYLKLKAKEQSEMAILQYLIAAYQRTHSGLSWETAREYVRRLLNYKP